MKVLLYMLSSILMYSFYWLLPVSAIQTPNATNSFTLKKIEQNIFFEKQSANCGIEFSLDDPLLEEVADGDTITISCSLGFPPFGPNVVTASSNCSISPTIELFDFIDIDNTQNCDRAEFFKLYRCEWRAKDACGNECTLTIYMKVLDDIPPVLTLPPDITLDCNNTNPNDLNVTGEPTVVTDECSELEGEPTFTDVVQADTPCKGFTTILRNWQVADICGNVTTETQKIVLVGPPDFEEVPKDKTVSCNNAPLPATLIPKADCPMQPTFIDFNEVRTDFNCAGDNVIYTLERTWTITNACGDGTSHTQIIRVADLFAPTISGIPSDISADCDNIPTPARSLQATDDCTDGKIPLVLMETIEDQQCIGTYTLVRTWEAADDCGNVSSVSQKIFVSDQEAPIITIDSPTVIEVECHNIPQTNVTVSDNCTPSLDIDLVFEEIRVDGNCLHNYTLHRTWTATDDCGNVSSFSQTVQVIDTIAPVLGAIPVDLTVDCKMIPSAAQPTATDNCDATPLISLVEDIIPSGVCAGNYEIIRTWTATDDCGNETTIAQTIKVEDNTPPVFSGIPADITIECDVPIPEAAINVTATDDCSEIFGNLIGFEEIIEPGICPQEFMVKRTWTVRDSCGNTTIGQRIITVDDSKAPMLTCEPDSLTIECDILNNESQAHNWNVANMAKLMQCAIDNCGTDTVTSNYSFASLSDGCGATGALTVIYTIEDDCGNSTTRTAIFTIEDNTPPVVTCNPISQTFECQDAATNLANIIQWNTDNITALENCSSDACGSVFVGNDFMVASIGDTCATGEITVNYSISDECGNTIIKPAFFEIVDTKSPIISSVPADQAVECDSVPPPSGVTITDECDTDVTQSFTETITSGDCPDNFTITRTWTAEDDCGNITIATQIIKVDDTTSPIFVECPDDITVTCNPDGSMPQTGTPIVIDNCDPNPIITMEDIIENDDPCKTKIIRRWVATDRCGNFVEKKQCITIVDIRAPELVNCFNDQVYKCPEDIPAPEFIDCNEVILVSVKEIVDTCLITRIYTVSDICGNKTSYTCDYVIFDDIPPTLNCDKLPDTIIVDDCTEIPQRILDAADDNCSEDYIKVCFRRIFIIDAIPEGSLIEARNNGNLEAVSCVIETDIFIKDICQNSSDTCRVTLDVRGFPEPILECPNDITVTNNQDIPYDDLEITYDCIFGLNVIETRDTFFCGEFGRISRIVRKWEVRDICNKEYQCAQTITFNCNTPPNFQDPNIPLISELDLTIQPNPIQNHFSLIINSPENGDGIIQLFDISGKPIKFLNQKLSKGYNQIEMDAANLPKGIYMLSFQLNDQIITRLLPKVN